MSPLTPSTILYLCFLLVSTCITIGSLPCVPVQGKTALVVGQDFYSITNYTKAFDAVPFGVMSYTALRSDTGDLTGLLEPIDYGSGVEWAQGLMDQYNTSTLQLGLWLVGACEDVAEGLLNKEIKLLAVYLGSLTQYVYLRVGYEFDSLENNYKIPSYIAAFKKIVDLFRSLGITNVAFVWHSYAQSPRDGLSISSWYPGDEYVDWCGVSIFQQPYACQLADKCQMPYAEDVASFCKERQKPLMIAESTPFGGIVVGDVDNEAGVRGGTWNKWFEPVLSFINKHDVRMWSYINCDWDAQPMWSIKHASGVQWGDTRVQIYPSVAKRWRDEVIFTERFKWSLRTYNRERNCHTGGLNEPAPNDDDDDNVYLMDDPEDDIWSWLWPYLNTTQSMFISSTANAVYLCLLLVIIAYVLFHYRYCKIVCTRGGSNDGYSIVQ